MDKGDVAQKRSSPGVNSEWAKMVTRSDLVSDRRDLSPPYKGVVTRGQMSCGTRAPDMVAPPSNTGVYGTLHPGTDESQRTSTDGTNGHFQRSYTALQKRSAEYEKQRIQLAQNIAYRYPNPGMPRSKQGRVGGSWRHIKEVLGYSGSRVVFVDGLVRLYDDEPMGSGPLQPRPVTPLYAPNRHDVAGYSRVLQRERDQSAWTASNSANSMVPPGSADPETSSRYRGFYSYN